MLFPNHNTIPTPGRAALCVGIDPDPQTLYAWGLPDSAQGARSFARRLLFSCEGRANLIKIQVAYFERFGSAGYSVLEEILASARAMNIRTLADVKRGDITTTMTGYASAWLQPGSSLEADAMTVHPFLGFAELHDTFLQAAAWNKTVFVLAVTSNAHGASIQNCRSESAATIGQNLIASISDWNQKQQNCLGAVLGATRLKDCVLDGYHGSVLVPGIGTQGGSLADLALLANAHPGLFVIPTVSRSIATAGPEKVSIDEKIADFQEKMTHFFPPHGATTEK